VITSKKKINWAWELLTEVYKIQKKTCVSVFEGNPRERTIRSGSLGFWKELIDEDRIILGNKKDNLGMGDQGPCGPCSEIHVDIRSAEESFSFRKSLVNNDHPQ
jgi:alanyl-tRNA synthetase